MLRPGPFISDGPDYGGLPWWLGQPNSAATGISGTGQAVKIRTSDPAFLKRVDSFYTKLFALLRQESLCADQGGPIIMAQIDNEYGLFGSDKEYLAHLRDLWRAGLGDGIVIHSTDPPTALVMGGSRVEGVLQTLDMGYDMSPVNSFNTLKASQAVFNKEPQPLMCSEIYPGNLNYVGDSFFPHIYDPKLVANAIDNILDTNLIGGSTSFALWLFSSGTDFGFWGGTLFIGSWKQLLPSYDFGAPVDEAGVIRPLFYLLRDVLVKHGAVLPVAPLPESPPVGLGERTQRCAIQRHRASVFLLCA